MPIDPKDRPLPTDAQEAIQGVINKLASEQDWAGPSAAHLEGRWKAILSEAYWLYRDAMLPGQEIVRTEDVIHRIFPGLPEAEAVRALKP